MQNNQARYKLIHFVCIMQEYNNYFTSLAITTLYNNSAYSENSTWFMDIDSLWTTSCTRKCIPSNV